MADTETRWVPMTEAAAAMGISIRTLQRRIKAGEIRTMAAGRGLLVAVTDIATDGGQSGELIRLIKHAETTERISMAAMAVLERERTELLADLARQRRSGRAARWTAVAAAAAAAGGLSFAVATARHRDYLADRLDASAVEITEIRAALNAETACRIEAEADRDRMAAAVAIDPDEPAVQ